MYVPILERNFPLSFLQWISYQWMMSWPITRAHICVPIRKFGHHGPFMDGLARSAIGLLPSIVSKDFPIGENP